MSTWGKVILTKQGEALLNQCLGMSGHYNLNQSNDPDSDTKGIVITRVSTGRYRYTNTSVEYLKERTDLATSDGATGGTSGFVENLNITGLKPITSSNSDQYGQALIQVQLDNQREDRNIKEEYPLGQLGVFARLEGSTEEILFTIVQYAGDTLPVIPAPVTPTLLNFGFYIAIATTETISIEMEFTGIVTAKQFDDYKLVTDETLNTLNEHTKNTENPHKVTAQQVGLGNVPNVTTDNQTPTFTQSSTLSEINSGEKLSTLFGKIKKAIVDLISHLANTNNPHSVTKSQVGLGNVDDTSDADKPISTATRKALDGKAPKTHASSSEDYGIGDREVYGHLKLFNGINSTADTRSGFAATPNAVKTAYEKAVEGVNAAEKAQETADSKLDKGFISNGYTGIDEVTARLNGIEEGAEVNKVTSVQGRTGDVTVTKADIDLGNVPNVTTNNQTPTFTAASSRTNINSGETLATIFGKIKKWFSDLKTIAFTGSYTDLLNKPTSLKNPYYLELYLNGGTVRYDGSAAAGETWYAPTSAGTAGYNLISNGSGAPVWQGPLYATCSTASGTQAKTVSITNFKLITGVRVFIKFNNTCANSAPTLNISGTGAKSMVTFLPNSFYNVSSSSGTRIQKAVNTWCAGDILEFVYDGTYWVCVGTSGYPQYSHRNNSYITIGTTLMGGAITYPNDTICDFLCDGTNDTTIIQRAINLASQGASAKIRFLDGDYFIDGELTLFSSIVFEGAGNVSLYVRSQGLLRYDTTSIGVSNKAIFRDIAVDFASPNKDTEGYVGAFENFNLTFENCTITKRTAYQSIWRLFFKCKVKMINTDVSIDMPNSGWGELYDCFWVFGESTVELLNTHIWFTGKNPVNNGVFYDSKGTMTGGWITNTKKDTSNHGKSYILHSSPITFLGTQIRCREFAQEWYDNTPNGFRPSLDSCKIEILDGGSFSCSHAGHIDLVLSSSSKTSIIPTCALISNSKLFLTSDHQLELRDYAFLEACYVNRINYKGSGSSSSAKTIDTSTVTSMVKPEFIDTEGTNNE
jgi:hypothetical protein|nr:MAG TPA: Minor structural protein [Caudoviricetes sp.]